MPRNTKPNGGKRYNLPAETLERARAELRGDLVPNLPTETVAKAQTDVNKTSAPRLKKAALSGPRRVPSIAELREEYGYVGKELRLLAVLAGSMLAIIVIASFVLPR